MKCQICKEEQAEWAWQPFGPNEIPDSFMTIGSHYRGFPVIKVGHTCKLAFQTGDFEVRFDYKGYHYLGKDHKVTEISPNLWMGETYNPTDFPNYPATAIMRDTHNGIDVEALVFDASLKGEKSDLLSAFLIAPQLVEACQELDALGDKITFYLERGLEAGRVDPEYYRAIRMALARIHGELQRSQEKNVKAYV